MEGLEKMNLVHARLLYIIAEMFGDGRIDDMQRLQLKKYVFNDDPQLFEMYEQNSNIEDLDNLILGME